ncbi:hypothetical protein [Massilia horti]|uniref:Uncharacterized protein n=1 Tax=Massilia horti TaxID=2562153 RepID=A0A4Y9T3M6_9BURK|nr:hypothetical protein [Massilia horti]TFW34385.1 hypothetical protein E4O92_04055 [Massilia horti]
MMLAPVFALLAACGGASDPSSGAAGEALSAEVSAKPANYVPTATEAMTADTPATPVDAVVAAAAAAAAAPQAGQDGAAQAQPEQLLAMTVVTAPTVKPDAVTTTPTATASTRDPLKQPFASTSIWNMPIGSGAQYVPARLSGNPGNNIWAGMPTVDLEHIVLTPTAPITNINFSNVGWSGGNRCNATGGLLLQVPMPSNYVVANNNLNSSATFLLADKRTLVQTQPLARCTAGAAATSMAKFANVDLYGPGITGAHGGSGLSAIGGTLRLGELRPGQTTGPRHALKVNVYAKEALFKCTTRAACYRWPAVTGDSYAVGWYGTANGNSNTAMKMGALLAIPYSTSIASLNLETQPAKLLAWTLQNYGAYIVDDTYAPGFDIQVEDGPSGSKPTEFKADWGFDMGQKVNNNTAWRRDMQKLVQALSVVNNNSATSIGGGGTPRQPLAPAIAP